MAERLVPGKAEYGRLAIWTTPPMNGRNIIFPAFGLYYSRAKTRLTTCSSSRSLGDELIRKPEVRKLFKKKNHPAYRCLSCGPGDQS